MLNATLGFGNVEKLGFNVLLSGLTELIRQPFIFTEDVRIKRENYRICNRIKCKPGMPH